MEDVPPSVDDRAGTFVPIPPYPAVQRQADEDTPQAPVRTGGAARRRSRHGDLRGRVVLHHEGHPSNTDRRREGRRSRPATPVTEPQVRDSCKPRVDASAERTASGTGARDAGASPPGIDPRKPSGLKAHGTNPIDRALDRLVRLLARQAARDLHGNPATERKEHGDGPSTSQEN